MSDGPVMSGNDGRTGAGRTDASTDPLERLRQATPARVALGRFGHGLPTKALLEFQLAHARARDAVHQELDVDRLVGAMTALSTTPLVVHSRAPDRQTYLQRPDLGRQLPQGDAGRLIPGRYEAAIVVADGLSARAVQAHAIPLLQALFDKISDWQLAPVVIATQARVALGDEIGSHLGAQLVAVLIGERPGLSSPDSLGVYLTWHPRPGRQDSERNCISNIRPPLGLSYELAARRLAWLMSAARRERLTGVRLKDPDATALLPASPR